MPISPTALRELTDGATYAVTASLTDAAGNKVSVGEQVADDVVALAITPVDGNAYINGANATHGVTISGTSLSPSSFVGQTVEVTLNGKTYDGVIGSKGSWSITISASDLAALTDGHTYSITATAVDKAGNKAAILKLRNFWDSRISKSLIELNRYAV